MKSIYKVELTKSAAKEFLKLPNCTRLKLLEAINFLSQNPKSDFLKIKKISGSVSSLYRIRVGDYRVLYEVINKRLIILIIKIGHRKDIYRRLKL